MMKFKEYVEVREGKIPSLKWNREDALTSSYLASDEAQESDKDMKDFHAHLAKIARSYLRVLNKWRDPNNNWLDHAITNLYRAMTVLSNFQTDDRDYELKMLAKYVDDANADFGNSESTDKRVEKAIHWGLIVVDRLNKMAGGKRRWYSTDDETDYSPEKSPASVRVPF